MKKSTAYSIWGVLILALAVVVLINNKEKESIRIATYNFSGVVSFEKFVDKLSGKTDISEMKISQEGCFYTVLRFSKETRFFFNGKEFLLRDSLKIKEIYLKEKDIAIAIIFPQNSKFGKLKEVAIKDKS
ncbi:MAG: hypothetical protein NDI62_03530 [Burkholderiales bacterium]|nr:hypothetical protein [Burkholderiales bacterium]